MLLHLDRLRNCSLGMRSPPVLRELASYFKGGVEKLQAGLVFWDLISPSSYTTGHASCCATVAECMLTLLPRQQCIPICTKTCIFNIPGKMLKLNFLFNLMRRKIAVLHVLHVILV